MIIKEYGKYIVYCDGCDETLIEGVSWKEAIEAVKQNDWKAEKVDGEWEHYCPQCQWYMDRLAGADPQGIAEFLQSNAPDVEEAQ